MIQWLWGNDPIIVGKWSNGCGGNDPIIVGKWSNGCEVNDPISVGKCSNNCGQMIQWLCGDFQGLHKCKKMQKILTSCCADLNSVDNNFLKKKSIYLSLYKTINPHSISKEILSRNGLSTISLVHNQSGNGFSTKTTYETLDTILSSICAQSEFCIRYMSVENRKIIRVSWLNVNLSSDLRHIEGRKYDGLNV